MSWRTYADWAKTRPLTLKLADRLGRGRGRFRVLDHLQRPPPPPARPDLSGWHESKLAASWIGHATTLLRIGGMTVLTDPVMSNRIGIGLGLSTAGLTRLQLPALSIFQLPPIDLILISHAHFDHLDRPTLNRMPRHIPVITASRTADLIVDMGFSNVKELRWGERTTLGPLEIRAQKVRHWGARTFLDSFRGYNAYVIQDQNRRILYGGDSAYQDYFTEVGGCDLAIIGIGAYNPWIQGHANPEQAWQMTQDAQAKWLFPMHYSTFKLSHEPLAEPLQRLLAAAGTNEQRIIIRQVGDLWKEHG